MNLLVIETNELIRDGLVSFLRDRLPGSPVIAAKNCLEALSAEYDLPPCLVILEFGRPDCDAPQTIARLAQRYPDIKFLFVSSRSDIASAQRAFGLGAYGYLLREEGCDGLLDAIDTIHDDERYLSPKLRGLVEIDQIDQTASTGLGSLTDRQIEVLRLIASGLSTREIASRTGLSTKTLDSHRRRIQDRLDVHTIAGLTRVAIAEGLVQLDQPSADSSISSVRPVED